MTLLTTRLEAVTPVLGPQVPIDLDERAFLFPAGKPLTRLVIVPDGRRLHFDAVFQFNATRTPPRLFTLGLEDARQLSRSLLDAVYQARTQHAITETMRVTLEVLTNGYRWQFGEGADPLALYFGTGCVWRVIQGMLRAIDSIAPVESN